MVLKETFIRNVTFTNCHHNNRRSSLRSLLLTLKYSGDITSAVSTVVKFRFAFKARWHAFIRARAQTTAGCMCSVQWQTESQSASRVSCWSVERYLDLASSTNTRPSTDNYGPLTTCLCPTTRKVCAMFYLSSCHLRCEVPLSQNNNVHCKHCNGNKCTKPCSYQSKYIFIS